MIFLIVVLFETIRDVHLYKVSVEVALSMDIPMVYDMSLNELNICQSNLLYDNLDMIVLLSDRSLLLCCCLRIIRALLALST